MKAKNNLIQFGLENDKSSLIEKNEIIAPPSGQNSRFLIYPNNQLYQMWNWLIVALLLYTAILIPVQICFPSDFSVNWVFFDTSIDFLFALDMFINFNKAYNDDYSRLITNKKEIAKHYLKSWFLIDLLSCLPIQITQTSVISNSNYYLRILRFHRVYRIVSLLKFLRLIKTSYYAKKFFVLLKISLLPVKISILLLATWLFVHNLGCIWILISEVEDLTYNNWYIRMGMDNYSSIDVYICAVYYVFTTITTIGYGDIVPVTNPEKIFAILLMGLGIGFYSIVIANLNSTLTSIDGKTMLLRSKTAFLIEFSSAVKLPTPTSNKIKDYIVLNADKHYYSFNDLDFLRDIPFALRENLSNHLHKTLVENIYFFKEKSSEFLSAVVPRLRKFVYVARDIIYSKGDQADEIFFINQGRVLFQTLHEITFRSYSQGSYFGEIEVLEGTPRIDTVVVASLEFEAFGLLKNDFFEVTCNFHEILIDFRDRSLIRKIRHEECVRRVMSVAHDSLRGESGSVSSDISNLSDLDYVSNRSRDDSDVFIRRDTGILISLKNDNEVKKRNRSIWSHAIEGNPRGKLYKRAKTMKAALEFDTRNTLLTNKSCANRTELVSKTVICKHESENTKIFNQGQQRIKRVVIADHVISKNEIKPKNSEKHFQARWIYNDRYHDYILHENYNTAASLRKVQFKVEEQGNRTEDAVNTFYKSSQDLSKQQKIFKNQIALIAEKYSLLKK